MSLTWRPPASGGAVDSYVLEAGTTPGTYYVRVRAQNRTGVGPPTADVTIVVPLPARRR